MLFKRIPITAPLTNTTAGFTFLMDPKKAGISAWYEGRKLPLPLHVVAKTAKEPAHWETDKFYISVAEGEPTKHKITITATDLTTKKAILSVEIFTTNGGTQ